MSEAEPVPKRTLSRRKAAEKSEKKWKEALEEEQTYEALPDVFLGSRIGTDAQIDGYKLGRTKTKNYREKTNKSRRKEQNNFTTIEDPILKEIIETFPCVTCQTQSLNVQLVKNISGHTEEVLIFCTKCNKSVLQKSITQNLSQNACQHKFNSYLHWDDRAKNGEACKKRDQENGDENSGVELLVCDVDVMKDEQQQKGVETDQQDFRLSSPGSPLHPFEDEGPPDHCGETRGRGRRRRGSRARKKPGSSPKPIRPCFFCSKMQARLSRHVKSTHVTHPYVQTMLRQPPNVQARMMRQLRSEGIFAENQRRLRAGREDLLRIRNQGSGELSPCGYCRGYYKKKLLWRHRATCIARPKFAPGEEPDEDHPEWADDGTKDCPVHLLLSPKGEEDNNNTEESSKGDGTATSGSDPPEITRIKEILDGLEHGIFSQAGDAPLVGGTVVNGFLIKQERVDDPDEEVDREEPSTESSGNELEAQSMNGIAPLPSAHCPAEAAPPGTTPSCQVSDLAPPPPHNHNEDQLLFDSLPAILGNSPQAAPAPAKKKKRDYAWNGDAGNNAFTDENYYYMWPEVSSLSSLDLQHHELIPCNTIHQSSRKRKSRSEFQYQFWKKEDEHIILNYFNDTIQAMKVPGKDACREFLSKHPDIKTDWTRVKYKVYNQIQKQKKRMNKE